MNKILIYFSTLLVIVSSASKWYDGPSRPYEFGYKLENNQHRFEKKDENGIIMGEFGFITADGVYHITVYATDENGNFKIVSMKNIKLEGLSPIDMIKGAQNAAPKSPPTTTTQAPPPPPSTPAPPPKKQTSTKYGCSNCVIPEREVTKVTPKFDTTERTPSHPETNIDKRFGNNQQGGTGSGATGPSGGGSSHSGPSAGGSAHSGPSDDLNVISEEHGGNDGGSGQGNGQNNQGSQGGNSGGQGGQNQGGQHQGGQTQGGQHQGSQNQGGQGGQSPTGQGHSSTGPSSNGNVGNRFSPNNNPSGGSSGGSPSSNNDKSSTNQPNKPSSHVPSAEEMKKMLGELLYKFNYTVGYHGHNEQGDRDGNKEGSYFSVGRDGVKRVIEYKANEFGYQPTIKLEKAKPEETPDPETERENRRHDYSFKWFFKALE